MSIKTSDPYNVVIITYSPNVQIMCAIREWDITKMCNAIHTLNKYKNKYYRFRFEKRIRHTENTDGMLTYSVEIIDKSQNYYVNGFVETVEDIKVKGEERILNRMKHGKFTKVIKGITSDWVAPFFDDDVLLEE